jgi:hypothetical protein
MDELREENDALRREQKTFSRYVARVDVQEGDVCGKVLQGALSQITENRKVQSRKPLIF